MAEAHSRSPRRVATGELLSASCALLLLMVMFLLEWYGVNGIPGRSRVTSAENGWHALTGVRWLMLLTIAVAVGSVLLHASQRSHGTKTDTGLAVTVLGTLTAALLVYRALIQLPAADQVSDQKLGAILGLLCAFGIAFGGWETMREERALTAGQAVASRRRDPVAEGRK